MQVLSIAGVCTAAGMFSVSIRSLCGFVSVVLCERIAGIPVREFDQRMLGRFHLC